MNKTVSKLNGSIVADVVLLIGEDGQNYGKMDTYKARNLANSRGLDLLQVSGDVVPVCKIVDYGKMMYERAKKRKQNKNAHKHHDTKEITFNFHIGDHDLEVKNKKVIKFLEKGMKVIYSMDLIGRECKMVNEGKKKFAESLSSFEDLALWDDCHFGATRVRKRKVIRSISTVLKPKDK